MTRYHVLIVAGVLAMLASGGSVAAAAGGGEHSHPQVQGEPQEQVFNLPRAYRDSLDNLDAIKELEHQLRCTCGCNLDVHTCRTTDFTCATSPAMHSQVLRMWDSAMAADDIVAAFVAEHGEYVLMAPPKKGFNLAGYFAPVVALIIGVAVIVSFMKRQRARVAEVGSGFVADRDHSESDLERLERELNRFES